ncbi:MarR family transcriptional regulator [Megasphaera paucivorans]|uniref:DNA-binding transcriptional regulator, MarR family n=1 Tax=Megasphaera paucivorans TaxID=349095 RepID=A0A1G9Q2J6_9FIRM|nr:MarR family transcriptional regulator [Megasphaera paucivorans]SDM05143.1 DNA-binding transcriptional regulator, MarR family [Megasphaera paucivorans]
MKVTHVTQHEKQQTPQTYEQLRLCNQLCFPLYAASKEVVKHYRPYLKKLDLTYTQYITMMVLWEKQEINIKELGDSLYLDSGTLTPLLKKLESKGYLKRSRLPEDERNVMVTLTQAGNDLRREARDIPGKMGTCVKLSQDEIQKLRNLLHKLLETL